MGKKASKKSFLKKLLAVALISSIIMALSGCIRYSTTMSVGSDGKMDISILYAVYDTSSLSGDGDSDSSSGMDEDAVEKLEEAGWKIKEYSKDSYKGYELAKKGIKATDLEEELKDTDIGFDKFSFTEKKGVYTLDWDVSNNTSEVTNEGIDLSSLAEYGGYMKFVLELPNKADNHNATSTSKGDKTLEWDMFKMDEPIHCEFKITGGSGFPAWAIGLIIGGVIVAAGIVVAIILINKKKAAPSEPAVAPYASTVTPSPVAPSPAPFAPQAPAAPVVPEAPAPQAPAAPTGFPQVTPPAAPTGFPQVTPPAAPEAPANDTPSDPGAPIV